MKKVTRKDLKRVAPFALANHEKRHGRLEQRQVHVLLSDMKNMPVARFHAANHQRKKS